MSKIKILNVLCLVSVLTQAQNNQYIENKTNGQVNWTEQFIEAKGKTFIDTARWNLHGQAEDMAQRGAIVVAQRNLLEIVEVVKITGTTTVKDKVTGGDLIITQVEGVIKGAQQVGEPEITKNYVQVTLRMPIYAQNGLAPLVHEKEENQQIEDNETPPADPQNMEEKNTDIQEEEIPEQLALNVDNKEFNPAMFPKFVDEKGNLVLDLSQYYDAEKGEFPKYMKLTKDVLKTGKNKKGIEIIDAIEDMNGNLKINPNDIPKVKDWVKNLTKVGKIAGTVLAFL